MLDPAAAAAALLARYDPRLLERGRAYAREGRVMEHERTDELVRATVQGSEDYDVTLTTKEGKLVAECDCASFERERRCKHIVALAVTLQQGPPAAADEPVPEAIRLLYSAEALFERIALYTGEPARQDGVGRYTPLAPWWRSTQARAYQELALANLPAIEETLGKLRAWKPRRGYAVGTDLGRIHYQLCEVYEEARDSARVRRAVPGPLDERHPGFVAEYDSATRQLRVVEKKSPLLGKPLALELALPLDPREPVRTVGGGLVYPSERDAWDLFALRALLLMLEAGEDPGIRKLREELTQPFWAQMLDRLVPPAKVEKEWGFTLTAPFESTLAIEPMSRSVAKAKPGAWKKTTFEAIFKEGAPAFEQSIARTVLACQKEARSFSIILGTAAGHEILEKIANHPRIWFVDKAARRGRAATEPQVVTDIIVGELTVRLEREKRGVLAPRFFVGEREVRIPAIDRGVDGVRTPFYDGVLLRERGEITVLSVEVPPALMPWVDASARLGDAFRFPTDAIPKLVETTSPLVAAGFIELPREALGDEVASTPKPALRVEWITDTDEPVAKVEVLLSLHPDAPLTGRNGPKLFTFERDGRRVFLERNKEAEGDLFEAFLDRGIAGIDLAFATPTSWVTRDLEGTLALAAWLAENPEDLRIEVKLGRPPSIRSLKSGLEDATLTIKKSERWLVFDGALQLGDTKLTLGAVLEAIRQAKRFVRAEGGVFLELGSELQAKLKPIAVATELVPKSEQPEEDDLRVREAFGATLADVAKLFGHVETKVDLEEYVRRFDGRAERPKSPKLEHGELRPYQEDGVAWMLALATWSPGCILADDMGLGKTVQTAAILKARAALGPALIVAPASVSSNWVRELARFFPSLNVAWFNAERRDLAALGPNDILVVSYNLLQRRKDDFGPIPWATVVLDEAQYVKNADADRTKAVRKLKRDFTIALTGTPVENDLGELHAIVDLAFPGLLSDERAFRETFRRPIETRGDKERLAILGRLLGPFLLRRTRAAVLDELPAREEITELLDLSEEERKRYLALRKVVEDDIAQKKQQRAGVDGMRIELLAALTRLRQLACEARLLDPEYRGTSTKTDRVVELATQLAAEGNHALVFSQFTSFLTLVRDALVKAGLRVAYLSGETPLPVRQELIDAFQRGDYDIFCVSLLAGGTGLNLTRASYVVHLDPWWNPAAEEQATARAHRMGQKNPVTVYRLVARGTIEEAVLKLHARKRELAAAVLEGRGEATAVSSEELLELLGVS